MQNLVLTINLCLLAFCYALRSTVESNVRFNQSRILTQKRDTRLTKLLLPCHSIQANLYTKTKPNNFCCTASSSGADLGINTDLFPKQGAERASF